MGIRVLIASHVRIYREGLERILQETPEITLAGSTATASDALAQAQHLKPDVGLIDMSLPGAQSAVMQIAANQQGTRVVALGLPDEEEEVLKCAQIGVAGYLTRDASMSDMVTTIRAAARGEAQISPRIAGLLFRQVATLSSQQPRRSAGLTERESQILTLVQQCMSNKMISHALGIELPTVKNHVHSILVKLGLHRRAEAIALLRRNEPAQPDGSDPSTQR